LFILIASVCGGWIVHHILYLVKKRSHGGTHTVLPFLSRLGICISVITGLAGIFILAYKSIFFPGLSWAEILETWTDLIPRCIIVTVLTGIAYTLTDHSLDAYSGLQQMQVEASRIRTRQLNLRFESLRNQISPHFLFNSLNTITSLIHRDTLVADTFIRHLAALYESVMRHYNSHTISLHEELKLVRDYGFLMQTRFENAFSLEIEIPEDIETWHLPPLSVQILVENSVKHNQLSMDQPLHVRVFIDRDYLVVRNNFIGEPGHIKIGNDLLKKPGSSHRGGLGLKNIESRYSFLTSRKIIIRKDDNFTVSIPLLKDKR